METKKERYSEKERREEKKETDKKKEMGTERARIRRRGRGEEIWKTGGGGGKWDRRGERKKERWERDRE